MKKALPLILIIMGILSFIATVVIAIISLEVPELIATFGFTIMGYLSIILFSIGIFKLKKQK